MKQVVTHEDNHDTVIEHGGYSFYIIRHLSEFQIEGIQYHNAVILELKEEGFARMITKIIRGNNNSDIYLKPIFLLKRGDDETENPILDTLTNGSIKGLNELDLILSELINVETRISELTYTNSISFEAQMITKLVSLLYVKGQTSIEPIPSIHSNINYYYPHLSVNFSNNEEHTVLSILEIAEEEGILQSSYFDRVYLCSSCSSGHLSYREVCPKCASSDTIQDDIIHHFPCGYVGPMRDFSNEIDDKLDCPKCNKRLRHIGVDYDKPAVIHNCNNCDHKFQDYYVNAKCLSCHTDKNVEHLNSKIIKRYSLTKKGEIAAIRGYTTTTKDIEEIVGTIKYDTFQTMLKYEIERLRQTEGSSNVCAIHISNSSQVYSKLGSDLQRTLLADIISVIRGNIRSSDIISFESSSTVVLSMNEIPTKIALKILREMVLLLENLIQSNFKDIKVAFETFVVPLDYSKTYEIHIKELLNQFS